MEVVDRAKYIKQYNDMAEDVIFDEKLPFATDIMDFAVDGKTSDRLKRVFDFFGDEEEIKEFTSRENVQFTEEDSDKFLSSVISANVTDISQSGSIYKKLMATGDTFRIKGSDCHSSGVKIELPVSEEEFVYRIKDSYITIEEGDTDYLMFFDYDEFCKETERLNAKAIWVRTPMNCKNHTKHGCCQICAGNLPDGVQNIGAFSTLMITEVATQNALSSMNKGRKENVNTLLTSRLLKHSMSGWKRFSTSLVVVLSSVGTMRLLFLVGFMLKSLMMGKRRFEYPLFLILEAMTCLAPSSTVRMSLLLET